MPSAGIPTASVRPQQQQAPPQCIPIPAVLQGITLQSIIKHITIAFFIAASPFMLYVALSTLGVIWRNTTIFGWFWLACLGFAVVFPDITDSMTTSCFQYVEEQFPNGTRSVMVNLDRLSHSIATLVSAASAQLMAVANGAAPAGRAPAVLSEEIFG